MKNFIRQVKDKRACHEYAEMIYDVYGEWFEAQDAPDNMTAYPAMLAIIQELWPEYSSTVYGASLQHLDVLDNGTTKVEIIMTTKFDSYLLSASFQLKQTFDAYILKLQPTKKTV